MVWKHKTFFLYNEKGIFGLSSAISTFCSEIKVEIKKKKKKNNTDLHERVFLECVLTKALQRERVSQQ